MKAGERDELKLVAHGAELALKFRDRRAVEFRLPIEGRRTVVGEQFAWELFVDGVGELFRLK